MPIDIVSKYRLVYKNVYMMETLHNFGGAKKLPAFDNEGRGFRDAYIVVNFDGPKHADIWASNFCKSYPDGTQEAMIQVNPDLRTLEKEKQKTILAHEWIEVMVKFRDGHRESKRVAGKIDMVVLFNTLRRRAFWQDSAEFASKMHSALRYLLVSRESIEEMLKADFEKSITDLRNMVTHEPNTAVKLIPKLIESFGAKWSVDVELVYDRLQEILFS